MVTAKAQGMHTRLLLLLLFILGLVVGLPSMASAHPARELWDGTYGSLDSEQVDIVTDVDEMDITRQSDNVTAVAQVPVAATSDMQFQRREGRQVWDGVVVEDIVKDIVVMGGTGVPGLSIIDITDPTDPEVLSVVSCGGFHSDVAVWENYAIQAWDGSARPCHDSDPADPDGLDRAPEEKGLRVFDITDPFRPRLVAFYGESDGIPAGVHNITVNGEEGLVYLNMAEFNSVDPPWGFVDLAALRAGTPTAEAITLKSMRDWSPTAMDGCHDSGLAPERDLYACAGITASYVWDLSDPRNPTELAVIPNPGINIHHGSRFTPDEQTLVLGDETAGAAAGTPEAVCTGGRVAQNPVGATWFYDVTTPQLPVLNGVFSPTDTEGEFCTSHFYGFVRDTSLMVAGWYDAGIEIVDYAAVADGLPGTPTSHAVFEPAESGFFSAYAWHGYVYGSSFEYGAEGKDRNAPGRGLWIIEVDGIEDTEPLAVDEGNSWGRWSSQVAESVAAGTLVAVDAAGGLVLPENHAELPTDAMAFGIVALGATALLPQAGGFLPGRVRRGRSATSHRRRPGSGRPGRPRRR